MYKSTVLAAFGELLCDEMMTKTCMLIHCKYEKMKTFLANTIITNNA